ncbi:MarR family transcriptional regulator [Streptomyces gancidicus BKS 13-15]|uniref:MarR family transcriptional regulator n=3 Tax=Streptomyces TaxID=1883 RepID=M3DEX9_STREZ|nr:MarR family transcriptional regulator [Streptomyces gancidicus BKS 13-15]GGS62731.1 MarR family transcriptional regulator [Streptomyces rubiginosus]
MAVMDDSRLAEELRLTIGRLVRTVRAVDTMPPGEAAVLGYLDRGGPLTTAEIAQQRGVSHQSAAKTVKGLLTQGLVRVEAHPDDGRKLLLTLTPAGHDRLAEERRRRADRLGRAINAVLTPDERKTLEAALPLLSRLSTHGTGE